jgi:hypothetical protein
LFSVFPHNVVPIWLSLRSGWPMYSLGSWAGFGLRKGNYRMLRNTLAVLIIAGFSGSAAVETGVQPAAATPLTSVPVTKTFPSSVQSVRWVYVPRRHGPRFRYRRPGYAYYYGGWWYPRPWWTINVRPILIEPEYPFYDPGYPAIYGQRYLYWRPGVGVYHGRYRYHPRWRVDD